MAETYVRWQERVDAADSEESRKELLKSLVRERLASMSDPSAVQGATFGIAALLHRLGRGDKARSEAESLVKMVEGAPGEHPDTVYTARRLLAELRGEAPPRREPKREARRDEARPPREERGPRPPRPERSQREERPAREDRPPREERPARSAAREASTREERPAREDRPPRGLAEARAAGREGRWADGLAALRRQRGPEVDLIRAWLNLGEALGSEDRDRRLTDLLGWLEHKANPGGVDLASLVGPLPADRDALVAAVEAAAAAHPERLDDLAAAALRHHLATEGLKAVAPWWSTLVGTALAFTPGQKTRDALNEARALGAHAVTLYLEIAFDRLVHTARLARDQGLEVRSLRRGVLHRGEPAERRVWTLRLADSEGERLLAWATPTDEVPPEGLATRLAERLHQLCSSTVVLADGSGNLPLVEAARARGLTVLAGADPVVVLATLRALPAVRAEAPRARPAAPAEAPTPPAERPARAPNPISRLPELLAGDDDDALVTCLQEVRKRRTLLRWVEDHLAPSDAAAHLRLARLSAKVWVEDTALPEVLAMLVRAANAGSDEALALLVSGAPEVGPAVGSGLAVAVARALSAAGWTVDRTFRGVTRREREQAPPLGALGDGLRDLWRVRVGRDGGRGEVWVAEQLSPEAAAGLPHLALLPGQRAAVVPAEGLESWTGPTAIRWDDSGVSALVAELQGWTARAAPAEGEEP